MAQRTSRSEVVFEAPFHVVALGQTLPAGMYEIQTEDEIVEGNERTVHIRIATALIVRSTGRVETVPIDPAILKDAVRLG